MNRLKSTALLLVALWVTGCASVAPVYQTNFDTVNALKSQSLPLMMVGEFAEGDPSVNKISIRGASVVSPYDKSYAVYLKHALEEDLKQASLWDATSGITISGVLLKNNLNAAGVKKATSEMSARFIVNKNGTEAYNKIHVSEHEWASSFVGAIALSNAVNNISVSVQKLIESFLLDEELVDALKN